MSAIACLLLARGAKVSGCDLSPPPYLQPLQQEGLVVLRGHSPEHLEGVDVLVYTAAIRADNPELQEGKRKGIPVLKRADMVAQLSEGRRMIAVAGSHGKTTTTSLVAFMLERAGLAPTFLLGGFMLGEDTNVGMGEGPYMVVEADEFDAAFLAYRPWVAVVTNVEPDHLDFYGDFQSLKRAFASFLAQVEPQGAIIACGDDGELVHLLPWDRQVLLYGLRPSLDLVATEVNFQCHGSSFVVCHRGRELGAFVTHLWGEHNVRNCLAAIGVGLMLGVPVEQIQEAVAQFPGVKRRFQVLGEASGVTVVDDYAHHPTEIRAILSVARLRFPGRRLVCLFQPHTYSRTRYLLEGFLSCFQGADLLLIAHTYAARETPAQGMDASSLAARLGAQYVGGLDEAVPTVLSLLRPGDVFMTIGAGDVDKVAGQVLEALRGQ